MIALFACLFALADPLVVILPDGSQISADRVDYHVGTGTVVIVEGVLFQDSFEDPATP